MNLHFPVLLFRFSDGLDLVLEVVRGYVHLLPGCVTLHEFLTFLNLLVSFFKLINRLDELIYILE